MYKKTNDVLAFDKRLSEAVHKDIQIGDYVHGSWPRGASVRLPVSGDGGKTLDYARQGHPGGEKVEKLIGALEMGRHTLCFSDGMRAMAAATEAVVRPGDTVLVHSSLYGGTIRYFNRLKEWGVNVQFVDLSLEDAGARIYDVKPQLIVLESVTNPLLHVLDMPQLMRAAARSGSYMIIDNTLPTAYGCVPLDIARQNDLDKAMVVLSITKAYTAGTLGGAVVTDSDQLGEKLFAYRQASGGNASPTDAPIYYDAIKTMGPRVQRLSENAQALVRYLDVQKPRGIEVLYPLRPESPDYKRAKELLLRAPGVFTIRCSLTPECYSSLIERLEARYPRVNSFNGNNRALSESTTQSHKSVQSAAQKNEAGITTQLIRLSPGVTDTPEGAVEVMQEILQDL